jgi:hypothetical protein
VEAQQCVELTSTNWPCGLTILFFILPTQVGRREKRKNMVRVEFENNPAKTERFEYRFPVAMAEGQHPIPSRTRQLSPPAPMVLRW